MTITTEASYRGLDIPDVTHDFVELDGARLHYVSAGSRGTPILLVHGWPETWWAFRGVVPLLAATHRVYAVDLRGFGESVGTDGRFDVSAIAEDLHALVRHLDVGPVHVACQDLGGLPVFEFASAHPEDVSSFTGVETTLPGYGMETLADVVHGGSWHLGFFASPGVAQTYLPGHERALLDWAYSVMAVVPIGDDDIAEFARTYSRPGGWAGSAGLYHSALTDHGRIRARAQEAPLQVPVLAVDGINAPFTENTLGQVARDRITAVRIEGVGHLVAQENSEAYASTLLAFVDGVDRTPRRG